MKQNIPMPVAVAIGVVVLIVAGIIGFVLINREPAPVPAGAPKQMQGSIPGEGSTDPNKATGAGKMEKPNI